MLRFWRRHEDPIESLLARNRPEPSEEYARTIISRMEAKSRRFDVRVPVRRLVVAIALTGVAIGLAATAGGVHSASVGVVNLVNVAKNTVSSPGQNQSNASQQSNGNQGGNGQAGNNNQADDESPGDHQYTVTICHRTGSDTNPYVTLHLSPQGAAAHLRNHPDDFVPTPPAGCPTHL
jgi:hypothetical protein